MVQRMTAAKRNPPKRAAEAWRLMFSFFMQTSPQRLEMLQKRGLTPNDSRVLFLLDPGGRPIGALARELDCDPSTATWLVDRLERLGLAERRPSDQDRRVKFVVLTAKGTRSKQEILDEYERPPLQMGVLSNRELNELLEIFTKLQAPELDSAPKRASPTGH
jgi:DNA-binding MarR family transcriptional regulator